MRCGKIGENITSNGVEQIGLVPLEPKKTKMPFGNFENLKGKVLQPPKDAAHLAKMSFQR